MCHVSRVTCNVSGVRCQVSGDTCHLYYLIKFFFGQSGGDSRWRVCYQRGQPHLVFLLTPKLPTGLPCLVRWSYFTHNVPTFYSWGIMYLYKKMINPEFQIFHLKINTLPELLVIPCFSMEVSNIYKGLYSAILIRAIFWIYPCPFDLTD